MEFNKQQSEAIETVMKGHNVFITGQGGVGKSEIIKIVTKKLEDEGKIVAVTSLTGISALSIGGSTIHSWAGIGLGDKASSVLVTRARKYRKKEWQQTDLLIIDEVSMLSADLFEKLDAVSRRLRFCPARAFGGLQLLLCGDFCQLPPVKQSQFCFESRSWQECNLKICYLTINMRQSDVEFQSLLSRSRLGLLTDGDKDLLHSRVGARKTSCLIKPTTMFSKRYQVEDLNNAELDRLASEKKTFNSLDETDHEYDLDPPEKDKIKSIVNKSCLAQETLVLATGAQVMLIVNIKARGLVNGSRGVVVGFKNGPIIKFLNGSMFEALPVEWKIKLSEDYSAFRKQIPVILAYATTIHKAQGATLDCVEVDLGSEIFSEGQFYTALSRVKSLDGLFITDLDTTKVKCNEKVLKFYLALKEKEE